MPNFQNCDSSHYFSLLTFELQINKENASTLYDTDFTVTCKNIFTHQHLYPQN